MKILYIANERRAAQVAAGALRTIAPNVTLAWAQSLNAGRRWVQEHRDAAAVIVDSEVQGQGCAAFVEHVRGLGPATPVVVIPQERLGALFTALRGWLQVTLEQKLAQGETARQELERRRESELAAAAARLSEVEERHKASLERATRICTSLQARLLEVETALRNAEERRALEAAASADQLAQRHAEFTAGLAQAAQWRDSLAQKLSDATAALDEARQAQKADAAAAAERLAKREAELGAALAEAAAARTAAERALADVETARQDAQQRREADLATAAHRYAALEEQLTRESDTRSALERELAEIRTESAHARRRMLETAAAVRRRAREYRERLEVQLRAERAERERSLAAREEEIRQVQLERETLQHSLRTAQGELERLQRALDDERQEHARAQSASDSERQRLSAECQQLRQSLDQVGAAFRTLEQVAAEHAGERARLESALAEREAQLSADRARHLAAEQAAQTALGETRENLRLALEESREVARLRQEAGSLRHELQLTRTRADALRQEADRLPVLQRQLEESQKENRRQFERAPYGLCQCTPDGTITHVNHSVVRLLGYNRAEDLLRANFAASVFECAGDLRWLVERAVTTGTREAVETTWKRRDGRRIAVRLHALTITSGAVAIAVEEVTSLRAVEQRLRQAQRMEAVGRLASEVAATCEALLRDATQDGRHWLSAMDSDSPLRHQGELLLGEVTRATGFLRQLAVYGNDQVKALEPVSVQRVLRDLEPVLKRVAGDDVELVLPKTSAPFVVDVEAERVERILVNVASYARGRMPNSGRVKIDLATTVVDRRFIAKYPGVRPGAHVLITITEIPGGVRPGAPGELREPQPAPPSASHSPFERPGVDLGALLGLIGECGGHLWMEAEPSGTLTLKIRLPKRVSDDTADAVSPAESGRRRPLARWLRHPRAKAASGTPVP